MLTKVKIIIGIVVAVGIIIVLFPVIMARRDLLNQMLAGVKDKIAQLGKKADTEAADANTQITSADEDAAKAKAAAEQDKQIQKEVAENELKIKGMTDDQIAAELRRRGF